MAVRFAAAGNLVISNGKLERLESAVLLALCVTYTITSIRAGLKEPGSEEQSSGGKKELFIRICVVLAGLAALSLGSKLFIFSAVNLARMMKISEEVIGISIVALGTSLPELFSSVIAVVRKENDQAIGILVGANIFNLLGVIGVSRGYHACCSGQQRTMHRRSGNTGNYSVSVCLHLLEKNHQN